MSNKNCPCAYENKLVCIKTKMIDVKSTQNESEIRLDVCLEEKKLSIIWGRITDTNQKPVNKAIVTLLKPQYINKRLEYVKVDTVLSDYDGFYQFELKESYKDTNYLVTY